MEEAGRTETISRGILQEAPNTLNNCHRVRIHMSNATTLFEDVLNLWHGYLPEADRTGIIIDLKYTLRHLRYLLHDGPWATVPEKPCYDGGDIGFDLEMSEAEKMELNEERPVMDFRCGSIKERLQQLKDGDKSQGLYDTARDITTQVISFAANLGA